MNDSTKPKIYVEATALTRADKTGVDYYAIGLLSSLVAQMPDTDFIFFHFADTNAPLPFKGKNVYEHVITKMQSRAFRIRHYLGVAPNVESLLGIDKIETIIFPNFYSWPVRSTKAKIYPIIPDTTYLDTPEYVAPRNRRLLRRLVARTMKRAHTVLTISRSTAKALRRHYDLSPERVKVLYPGFEAPRLKMNQPTLELPREFILFIGTLEPRKNIANLIRGYLKLSAQLRRTYPLILAGKKGWLDDEIQLLLTQHAQAGVRPLGYVDEATRAALYAQATIFAYPVRYEGFGIPIIEAQANGIPVLTSKNSSLPEAAGEAAVYCGTSSHSIAQGLNKLLSQPALRKKLAQAGPAHAKQFSWQRSASELQKLLKVQ